MTDDNVDRVHDERSHLDETPDGRAGPPHYRPDDVDAIEARLRDILPPDDPLHPDRYHGPWGMLWSQAAAWKIAAHERSHDVTIDDRPDEEIIRELMLKHNLTRESAAQMVAIARNARPSDRIDERKPRLLDNVRLTRHLDDHARAGSRGAIVELLPDDHYLVEIFDTDGGTIDVYDVMAADLERE